MVNWKRCFNLIEIGLVALFILAACSPATATTAPITRTGAPVLRKVAQPASTATATDTSGLTATETPTPTATAAVFPIVTFVASPTVTPDLTSPALVQPGWNAYCRKGPGTVYFAITFLESGKTYPVVGRDGIHTWWQVQLSPKVRCWVGDPTATLSGPVESAPLVLAPSLPNYPQEFDYSSHCDPVKNTMTVVLTWKQVHGATGYSITRNGELIAQVGADASTFTDQAPRGVDLEYDLAAFNDFGVSSSLTAQISACQ